MTAMVITFKKVSQGRGFQRAMRELPANEVSLAVAWVATRVEQVGQSHVDREWLALAVTAEISRPARRAASSTISMISGLLKR